MEVTTVYKILEKRILNENTALLKVEAPDIAKKILPGQFVIIRIDEFGERIPLTVAETDNLAGSITLIAQMIGFTTIKLGNMKTGEYISDVIGPLGHPTQLDGYNKACVIGGGVGAAIAYPQAKYLYSKEIPVDIIAGFRNKDIVILEEEMKNASDNLYITTDDGSYCEKGFVTDRLIKNIEDGKNYDIVLAIGPLMMMRAVANATKQYNINTIVSLNSIMIDGTGMCGSCRVTVGGKMKFACVDGPDFDAHEVDFESLIRRNNAYRKQELEKLDHACRLYGGNR
jgi:ferredoxin--NADP+ reductase